MNKKPGESDSTPLAQSEQAVEAAQNKQAQSLERVQHMVMAVGAYTYSARQLDADPRIDVSQSRASVQTLLHVNKKLLNEYVEQAIEDVADGLQAQADLGQAKLFAPVNED
ncbi:MAG: hypothetical protein JWN38_94 [Candidatus Saccharibacteria bacterium]|nr:hypothetical protein [Candidatus Saccharibacteria bacterium]